MTESATAAFVPENFDAGDFDAIEPLGNELLDRRIPDLPSLRQWVLDAARLFEAIDEHGSRVYIDHACQTDDEVREKAFLHFIREIQPKVRPLLHKLQQRYLRNPQRHDLYDAGFAMQELNWQADVDLFRPENVPLQTEEAEVVSAYDKAMAAMTVEFQGRTRTLQEMAVFLEGTDREVREQAWRLSAERRYADREKVDAQFEQLLTIRTKLAENAELSDYRRYAWTTRKRFDYIPDDCEAFAESIERRCLPIVRKLDEQRREALGVDTLRPWDLGVDLYGRAPLQPFDPADIDGFVDKTREIFARISGDLADQFESLRTHGNLDLASRPGKQPGGFQSSLERSRQPFIFMNAAGTQRDVETLLHEGGHAFHYLAGCHEENLFVRHAPLEFCEVASMSMELLGMPHFGVFYDDKADADRARRSLLEGIIRFLPWMAIIDLFQHWIYTHPGHTAEQRTAAWVALLDRFGSGVVDHTGLEQYRDSSWHRQLHLFHVPFYYIEYGIAQLGALQVWNASRQDAPAAVAKLFEGLSLGGTRPLPDLFNQSGLRFAFDDATLGPLLDAIQAELDRLPA